MIVIHLDAEDDAAHDSGERVGNEQGPVVREPAIDGKQQSADAHEQERASGNVVGSAGANGVYRLRQVAQQQADGGRIAHNEGN